MSEWAVRLKPGRRRGCGLGRAGGWSGENALRSRYEFGDVRTAFGTREEIAGLGQSIRGGRPTWAARARPGRGGQARRERALARKVRPKAKNAMGNRQACSVCGWRFVPDLSGVQRRVQTAARVGVTQFEPSPSPNRQENGKPSWRMPKGPALRPLRPWPTPRAR
jgi:hypothetical protein